MIKQSWKLSNSFALTWLIIAGLVTFICIQKFYKITPCMLILMYYIMNCFSNTSQSNKHYIINETAMLCRTIRYTEVVMVELWFTVYDDQMSTPFNWLVSECQYNCSSHSISIICNCGTAANRTLKHKSKYARNLLRWHSRSCFSVTLCNVL